MTARRGKRLKQRDLRDLMREVPDGEELWNTLWGLSNPPNIAAADRAAAIMGATFLEYGLRRAITHHFEKNISAKEIDALFDGGRDGPLATFYAKTHIAHALGILTQRECHNLDSIRRIRNAFAHSMRHFQFTAKEVDRECSSLWIGGAMTQWSLRDADPKTRFATAVSIQYIKLIHHAPGVEWPPKTLRGLLSGR